MINIRSLLVLQLLLFMPTIGLVSQSKFFTKIGLIHSMSQYRYRTNNIRMLDMPKSKDKIGLLIRSEYVLTKNISVCAGAELLKDELSYSTPTLLFIDSNIERGEYNHKINTSELHIPLGVKVQFDIMKIGGIYGEIGIEKRFFIQKKGEVSNLVSNDVYSSMIDYRMYRIDKNKILNFRDYFFALGLEYYLKNEKSIFLEFKFKNISLDYFYGGSVQNQNVTWIEDMIFQNLSFINISAGFKF